MWGQIRRDERNHSARHTGRMPPHPPLKGREDVVKSPLVSVCSPMPNFYHSPLEKESCRSQRAGKPTVQQKRESGLDSTADAFARSGGRRGIRPVGPLNTPDSHWTGSRVARWAFGARTSALGRSLAQNPAVPRPVRVRRRRHRRVRRVVPAARRR